MKLPGALGSLDFEDWILGVWSGFIQGGSSAVLSATGLLVIDPKDFNAGTGKLYVIAGGMFLWNGTLGALAFLRNRPAPAIRTVEKTTETTQVGAKAPVVVETVKETTVSQEPSTKG